MSQSQPKEESTKVQAEGERVSMEAGAWQGHPEGSENDAVTCRHEGLGHAGSREHKRVLLFV